MFGDVFSFDCLFSISIFVLVVVLSSVVFVANCFVLFLFLYLNSFADDAANVDSL